MVLACFLLPQKTDGDSEISSAAEHVCQRDGETSSHWQPLSFPYNEIEMKHFYSGSTNGLSSALGGADPVTPGAGHMFPAAPPKAIVASAQSNN